MRPTIQSRDVPRTIASALVVEHLEAGVAGQSLLHRLDAGGDIVIAEDRHAPREVP